MRSISLCPPPHHSGKYCPSQATKTDHQRHQSPHQPLNYHSKSHQFACACKCRRDVSELETGSAIIRPGSAEGFPQEICQSSGLGEDGQQHKSQVPANNNVRSIHITILTPKPKNRHRDPGSSDADDDIEKGKANVPNQLCSCRTFPSHRYKNNVRIHGDLNKPVGNDIYGERLAGMGVHSRPTSMTCSTFQPSAMFSSLRNFREPRQRLRYNTDSRRSFEDSRHYRSISDHPCARFVSWRQSGSGKLSDRIPLGCLKAVPSECFNSPYEYTDTCESNLCHSTISLSQLKELESLNGRSQARLCREHLNYEANRQLWSWEENLQEQPCVCVILDVGEEKPNGFNLNSCENGNFVSDLTNEHCAQLNAESTRDNSETFNACDLKHKATILHSHKYYGIFQDTLHINVREGCRDGEVYLCAEENESLEPYDLSAFEMMTNGSVNEHSSLTGAKGMSKNNFEDKTTYMFASTKGMTDPICTPPQTVGRGYQSSSESIPASNDICITPHNPDDKCYAEKTCLDNERALLNSMYDNLDDYLGTSTADPTGLLNVLKFVRPVFSSIQSKFEDIAENRQHLPSQEKHSLSESFNNSINHGQEKSVQKAHVTLLNESGNRNVSETDTCDKAEHKQQSIENDNCFIENTRSTDNINHDEHAQRNDSEDCYCHQPSTINGKAESSKNQNEEEEEDPEKPIYYGDSRPCIYDTAHPLSKACFNTSEVDESDGKDQQGLYCNEDFDSLLSQSEEAYEKTEDDENIVQVDKANSMVCNGNSLCQNTPMGGEMCIPLNEKTPPECIHNDSPRNTYDARTHTAGPCLCCPRITQSETSESESDECLSSASGSTFSSSLSQSSNSSTESLKCNMDTRDEMFGTNISLSKHTVSHNSCSSTAAYLVNADESYYAGRNDTTQVLQLKPGHKQQTSKTSKNSRSVKDSSVSSSCARDGDKNGVKKCKMKAQNCSDCSLKPSLEGAIDRSKTCHSSRPVDRGNYLRKVMKPSAKCQILKKEMEQFVADIQMKYKEILKKSNCPAMFQVETERAEDAHENYVPCRPSDDWSSEHPTDLDVFEDNKSSTHTSFTTSSEDDEKSENSDEICEEWILSDEEELLRDTKEMTQKSQKTVNKRTGKCLREDKELCKNAKEDYVYGQENGSEGGKESDENDKWISPDKNETQEKSCSLPENTEDSKKKKDANEKMPANPQRAQLHCCVRHNKRFNHVENADTEIYNVSTEDTIYFCTPYSEGSCQEVTKNTQNACSTRQEKTGYYEDVRDKDFAAQKKRISVNGNILCCTEVESNNYNSKARQCLKNRNSKIPCIIKKGKTARCGQAKQNLCKRQKKDDEAIHCVVNITDKDTLCCEPEKNKDHCKTRRNISGEGTYSQSATLCCIPLVKEQNRENLVYSCVPFSSKRQKCDNNKGVQTSDERNPDRAENSRHETCNGFSKCETNEGSTVACEDLETTCIIHRGTQTEDCYLELQEEISSRVPNLNSADSSVTVGSAQMFDKCSELQKCNSILMEPPGRTKEDIFCCEFKTKRLMFLELENIIFRRSLNSLMTERCSLYSRCNKDTAVDLSQTQKPLSNKSDPCKQQSDTSSFSYKNKPHGLQSCCNPFKFSLHGCHNFLLDADHHTPRSPPTSPISELSQSPNLPEANYRCSQMSSLNDRNTSSKWRQLFLNACNRQLQLVRQQLMRSSSKS